MRENVKKYIPVYLTAILFVICFIIGSISDYDISTKLYSENNLFGIILASAGEIPMYGGMAFAGGLLVAAVYALNKSKPCKIIALTGAVFATAFGIYFQGYTFCSVNAWGALFPEMCGNLLIAIPVGIVLVLPFFFIGFYMKKSENIREVLLISLEILLVGFLQIAIINVTKGIFHRPRFRSLAESGAAFQPVFVKFKEYADCITAAVTKEEFKSFPSGHTGSGALSFVILSLLPQIRGKENLRNRTILFFIGVGYTCLLAFSRIVVGAHYLTDVSFGGFLTLALFFVCDIIFYRSRIKTGGGRII